jgi:hypothetical protein
MMLETQGCGVPPGAVLVLQSLGLEPTPAVLTQQVTFHTRDDVKTNH